MYKTSIGIVALIGAISTQVSANPVSLDCRYERNTTPFNTLLEFDPSSDNGQVTVIDFGHGLDGRYVAALTALPSTVRLTTRHAAIARVRTSLTIIVDRSSLDATLELDYGLGPVPVRGSCEQVAAVNTNVF